MIESQEEISKNNQEHYKRLRQCEDWVNAGPDNKITEGPVLMREIPKGTINKKSRKKPTNDLKGEK
jgi:hypothetical protein